MKCPKCNDQLLSGGPHGTQQCTVCGGVFSPRTRLGDLLGAETATEAEQAASSVGDSKAGACPVDRVLMRRALINLPNTKFHLERCGSCFGVWFDAGEWQSLASSQLAAQLDELWSSEWQAGQREVLDRANYVERITEAFGADLTGQLFSLAEALKSHPRRSQALAILREESDD